MTYGQHILTGAPPTYKDKYKGVSICLLILSRALSGGYCNLGVFQVRSLQYSTVICGFPLSRTSPRFSCGRAGVAERVAAAKLQPQMRLASLRHPAAKSFC